MKSECGTISFGVGRGVKGARRAFISTLDAPPDPFIIERGNEAKRSSVELRSLAEDFPLPRGCCVCCIKARPTPQKGRTLIMRSINRGEQRLKATKSGKRKRKGTDRILLQLINSARFSLAPATSDEITTLAVNRRVASSSLARGAILPLYFQFLTRKLTTTRFGCNWVQLRAFRPKAQSRFPLAPQLSSETPHPRGTSSTRP